MSFQKLAEISKACNGGMEFKVMDNLFCPNVAEMIRMYKENGLYPNTPQKVLDGIVGKDCLVTMWISPEGHNDSYSVLHYDLEMVIEHVWEYLVKLGKIKS